MVKEGWLRNGYLFFPEIGDFIVFTLTYLALVGVTHPLLGPKGTLVLHVDLISFEKGGGLRQSELYPEALPLTGPL